MTVSEFINKVGFQVKQEDVNNVNSTISGIKNTAQKVLGAIGIGLSISGAANFIKQCVSISSEVEEVQNKFDVVFQGMTDTVEEWAQSYADAIGRNKNEIKSYLADQQNLLVGFGMTREKGFELSKQMTTLALDLASFANLDETTAVNAMSKAVMGQSESAKTLGAVLNDTTRKTAMLSMGLTGTYDSLDQLTKMQVNYQAILMQSPDAIGDCERSLNSYASTMKQFQAKLKEIKTLIGQFFMPTFQKVLRFGSQGLTMLRDGIQRINNFANSIGGAERLLKFLAATLAMVMVALNFSKITSGLSAVMKLLTGIKISTVALVAGILLLALLVEDFFTFMRGGDSVIGTILEKAGVDCDALRETIRSTWNKIFSIISTVGEKIKEIVGSVGRVVKTAFKGAMDAAVGFVTAFRDGISWIEKHKNLVIALSAAVGALTTAIIANNVAHKIMDAGGIARIAWMAAMRAQFLASTIALHAHTAATWLANTASTALSATLAFLTSPITLIIAAIAALIAIIVLLVKNWDKVKEAASKCWNAIKSAWSNVANWFKSKVIDPIVGFFTGLWDKVTGVFQGIIDWVKENWQSIVLFIINPFAGIFSYLYENFEGFRNFVNGIVEGIASTVTKIKDKIVEGFTAAIEWIKSLPSQAIQWGKDIINGIVDGIKGAASGLAGAVSGVAGVISSFLHFSKPDEGPLSNFDTYMPDMIDLMAKGILAGRAKIKDALGDLTGDMAIMAKANIVSSGTAASVTSNNSSTRTIVLNNNFNQQFSGDRVGQQKSETAMRSAATDITSELARALAYAR